MFHCRIYFSNFTGTTFLATYFSCIFLVRLCNFLLKCYNFLFPCWVSWYSQLCIYLDSSLSGKLVEEEEGNFALWISYILTGAGANLVSWLLLPRSAVSLGASGAVFGLFAISVLVKVTRYWFLLSESISLVIVIHIPQNTNMIIADVVGLEENHWSSYPRSVCNW